MRRADLSGPARALAEMAIHESGHAIAGVLLSGRLASCGITGAFDVEGAIAGHTNFVARPPGRDAEIAYAGCWAQAKWRCGHRPPTLTQIYAVLDSTGREDRALLSTAGGMSTGAAITPLLARCWPAVCTLAGQICTDNVVRHADVCKALGIPTTDNGHELALIRGGAAPGSFRVTRPVTV